MDKYTTTNGKAKTNNAPNKNYYKIILASGSPRRRELLARIVPEFEIHTPNCEEFTDKKKPADIVQDLSAQKADACVAEILESLNQPALIIASDTLVAYGQEILGKPADKKDARRMLSMLQNKWHSVYTGVTIKVLDCRQDSDSDTKKLQEVFSETFVDQTRVHMVPMTSEDISEYVEGGSPLDKAGAYGIQDKDGKRVDKIEGCFETVMGLPVDRVAKKLKNFV